jgi:FkbM family methyltransferase
VFIPIINEIGFDNYLSLSEPWMLYVIKTLYHSKLTDGTFVDVGMNLGQTLIKVKAVDPYINYLGFEPNPYCINYLNKLIDINKYINTKIYPIAIGSKTYISKLRIFNETHVDSSASLIENFRSEVSVRKMLNIPVFKFSDIEVEESFKIGVLKIDVEGAELDVLESFAEKIKSDTPVILMEILPVYNKDKSIRFIRQEKIYELLYKMDYSILRVIKKNNTFQGIQHLTKFEIHSDLNLCDYIFVPYNKVERMITLFANTKNEPDRII